MSVERQQSNQAEPESSRPVMPKGYGVPEDPEGMLPWSHARALLQDASIYWIASTRPDGRPHVIPIWGAWVDDALYFEGGSETRWARNLRENPDTVVHIERGEDVVIIEGVAEELAGPTATLAATIADAFRRKYPYHPDPDSWDDGGLYVVRPRVARAWNDFPRTATRYRFSG